MPMAVRARSNPISRFNLCAGDMCANNFVEVAIELADLLKATPGIVKRIKKRQSITQTAGCIRCKLRRMDASRTDLQRR